MDLRVALTTRRIFLSPWVHSFLPILFIYFLSTSSMPYPQASLEYMPSKPSSPLFHSELFLIPLPLLLASAFLIYSTSGLTRMVYSFIKVSFTFWNHHLPCVWISCENTTTPHSPATPTVTEGLTLFRQVTVLVKWVVRMMEIRWMSSDVNRPDGVDERRRRWRW